MVAYSCGIDQYLLLQKTKSLKKNLDQMDENTDKNCHLYEQSLKKVKNSFTQRSALTKNFSRSEKVSS